MIYRCVNCGCERAEHNPNLVNEPVYPELQWFEVAQDNYPVSILECMEAPYTGYVSPDPEREAEEEAAALNFMPTSTLIVYYPHRRGSVAILLE